MTASLDLEDIQGLVARGYQDLRHARFVLLGFGDGAPGAWVRDTGVTSAAIRPSDDAVNLAFTASGLAKVGASLDPFSAEFVQGMATPHRSRLLGDEGDAAPERWVWGGPSTPAVDAVLLLYARDAEALAVAYEAHRARWTEHGLTEVHRLDTTDLDGVEPFGFKDGVSQPIVQGLSKTGPAWNTIRAGEFVLGYPNEYGQYTNGGQTDLGRNGTYLVVRQLAQDVPGFWSYLAEAAGPDRSDQVRLAAKMVGRWPGGAPLVLSPNEDDPALTDANDFAYFDQDRYGFKCPIGAHVRRANPRDSLDPRPGSADSLKINKRHRLLRRGREYDTGLHFMCLNANISRQFEFVQHTWINNPHFDGLHDEPDPLVSRSAGASAGGAFRAPATPVRRRLTGLPRFVTVRGGAYFFLPGLRALRSIAG